MSYPGPGTLLLDTVFAMPPVALASISISSTNPGVLVVSSSPGTIFCISSQSGTVAC